MEREPKVACIELDCPLMWESKDNDTCDMCSHRLEYVQRIASVGCQPPLVNAYSIEEHFRQVKTINEAVLDELNIYFFGYGT